ncbi:MAG: amidohydrolase family protein [Chloroflexi bacterium]|nr:amidohydrolase family protein [Chloroflexota bacterium]
MSGYDILLRHGRLLDHQGLYDVALRDGLVAAVGLNIEGTARETYDVDSRLILPAFVDSHVHLDKAFLADEPNIDRSTRAGFFATLREFKCNEKTENIKARMRRALEQASCYGTTTMRAQIDVDNFVGLRGFEAALELQEEVADWMDLQLVAFPQEGIVRSKELEEATKECLRLGADAVGGGPSFDTGSFQEHLDAVFALAEQFDCDIDLHTDLSVPPGCPPEKWELAYVVQRTRQIGWQNRVTVAHMRAVSILPADQVKRVIDILLEAGIFLTVAPGAELNTAKAWSVPPAREIKGVMTDLEALILGGVNVSYTTGHVRDPFNPYGNADMLLEAMVLTCARNLGEPVIAGTHVLKLGTENPARAIRLSPGYSVEPGCQADLLVIDAEDPSLAVRHVADRLLVMKAGRVVAQERKPRSITKRLPEVWPGYSRES